MGKYNTEELPKPKDIEWMLIDDILNHWNSCDSYQISHKFDTKKMNRKGWKLLLDEKRKDSYYKRVFPLIKENGFIMPLAYELTEDWKVHSNGHHRLAVAVDLGYKYVPYVCITKTAFDGWWDVDDFKMKRLLHPDNPDFPKEQTRGILYSWIQLKNRLKRSINTLVDNLNQGLPLVLKRGFYSKLPEIPVD